MDNLEVKALIEAFKGYRDLLSPIQSNLHDFIDVYDSMREDMERLNVAFSGNIQGNLDKIYQNLSRQAEQAGDLSARIDKFVASTSRYNSDIARLAASFEKLEERLKAINALENEVETQIGKLDVILEDKRKNYNVRELQKSLEGYNDYVRKMNEFINRDIADAMTDNYKVLMNVKAANETLQKKLDEERGGLGNLTATFESTNTLLKQIAEREDVNEAYIFDILDRWAESRKVKKKR